MSDSTIFDLWFCGYLLLIATAGAIGTWFTRPTRPQQGRRKPSAHRTLTATRHRAM